MLIQLKIENFYSIKDEIKFSMVASSDDTLECNVINFKGMKLLKSAVIYGPNASGKSNILRAMQYISFLVGTSHNKLPGQTLPFIPFKLDEANKIRPSKFELVFTIDNVKYIYGFSLDGEKIYTEYLYHYPKGKLAMIFDRDINRSPKIYKFNVDKKIQNEYSHKTPENTLYLSKSANLNYEKTSLVAKWFMEKLVVVINDLSYLYDLDTYTKTFLRADVISKAKVNDFISKADNGILNFEVKDRTIDDDYFKDYPKEIRDALVERYRREVETKHKGRDREGNEIEVVFKMSEEASGTQVMFNIAGPFLDVLSNGGILIMDELEAHLHPHLTRYLVDMFNNPEYNKGNAQLIFATHNTTLLHGNVLRRDQIWLTEKKDDNSTDLRSVFEYKARKDENIEKGYLSGRYGAIPILDLG
jgi:AAA15 family ATPase/GTPase